MADLRARELAISSLVLIVALNILFFPAIWGGKTLLAGARDAGSIMPGGAYQEGPPPQSHPAKTNDPGAISWFAEANYALIHNEVFHDHVLPLWNPYNGCGVPWLANMQSQVLNPLQILAWLKPAPGTVDIYILARLFCAGLLTFLFLRQFVSMIPAIFGALAYMQCGYMMLYIGMPDISVCAYVPGLFWRLERLLRQPDFRCVVLVAIFTMLLNYAGMPEVAFLSLLFGALFFLMRVVVERTTWRSVYAPLARYCGASMAGIMLAAPQILPFLEYLHESFNAHVRNGEPPGMVAHSDFFLHVLNYFNPLIYGPLHQPDLTADAHYSGVLSYWGTITFFLALLGAATSIKRLLDRRRDGRRSIDLIAVYSAGLVSLLLAKRFAFPLVHWIGSLPVFKLVVFVKYDEPFIGLFVATLAAIGLHWIAVRATNAKSVLACFAVFALLYLSLLIVNSHYVVHQRYYCFFGGAALVCALIAACLCFLCARTPRRFLAYSPWLVAAVFVELACNFVVPTYYKFNHFSPAAANPYAGAPYIRYLRQADKNFERVFAYDGVLYPDWSSAFELCDTRDLDALYPQRYLSFLRMLATGTTTANRLGDDNLSTRFTGTEPALDPFRNGERIGSIVRLWQLTSSRFILTSTLDASSGPLRKPVPGGLTKAYQGKDIVIYKLPNTLPRAAMFHHVVVCEDKEAALKAVSDSKTNIFNTAVIERSELDDSLLKDTASLNPAAVPCEEAQLLVYHPTFVSVTVDSTKPSFLLLNDTLYPGWKAYVDGQETKLVHADYLFRGLFVPPGKHTIEYKYESHWFYIGLLVAAAGMILLGLWGLSYDSLPVKLRRNGAKPSSSAPEGTAPEEVPGVSVQIELK